MSKPVYVLGGYQSDFARHWSREGQGLFEILRDTVEGALVATDVEPGEVEVGHVGNFAGELFTGQGHLGGFFASLRPEFAGIPTSRHEAACASGSIAVLGAAADIEAGRYELACVVGLEQMRNVAGAEAGRHLGAAAWLGREALDTPWVWPHLFDRLTEAYDGRYGVRAEHLARIGELNFHNAKRNPNAQTRGWTFPDGSFREDDERNPVVCGRVRRHDCSQLTDGGAAILLASRAFAERWAQRRGISVDTIGRLRGWGHRTDTMRLEDKLSRPSTEPYLLPHLRGAIVDAWRRAGVQGPKGIDGIELHDCFTITEYVAIDHLGITPPGEAWKAVEDETIAAGGRLPVNPSGGLIGGGHPVGASGVRMVLDAARQTMGAAGDYQVPGARTFQTLNIGGSATTAVSFVVGH